MDVFAENIGFQIHRVSNSAFPQGRGCIGMGNDPNPKTTFADRRDGQADPIDSDGTLEHQVPHHFRQRGNFEHMVLARLFPATDLARAVDVAGNEMPSQPRANLQRSLQIDQRTGVRMLEIGSLPGFLQ